MRSYLIFIIFIFLISGTNVYSEEFWQKTFGGKGYDTGRSVLQTIDGNLAVAGYTASFFGGDVEFWLIKCDMEGNELWNHTYGVAGWDDECYSAIQRDNGYYVMVGTNKYAEVNPMLVTADEDGNEIIRFLIGDGENYSIRAINDPKRLYIVAGRYIISYGNYKAFLSTCYSEFYLYGGDYWSCFYSAQETLDGGYIAVGNQYPGNIYLVKVGYMWFVHWEKSFGGAGDDIGYCVQQTAEGGYIVVGFTTSYGAGNKDVWLIKTNASGDILWDKTYGGSGEDCGYYVIQTNDGGYVVVGYTSSWGAGGKDLILFKTDWVGNVKWANLFGGENEDIGYCVKQLDNEGFIISGETHSYGAGNGDVWLIYYNPEELPEIPMTTKEAISFTIILFILFLMILLLRKRYFLIYHF